MRARRNPDFDWRRPLLPRREYCEVVTPPPPPPSPVLRDSITVGDIVFIEEASRLKFSVSWEVPTILNGNLSFYELCLGQEAVSDQENCTAASSSLCVTAPEVEIMDKQCTPLELNPSGFPSIVIVTNDSATIMLQVTTTEECCDLMVISLLLQIRAQNMFGFFGNWSEAISVNSSRVTTSPMPSSDGLEGWIYGVIVAAVLLLVASLLAVVLIFVCRHYYLRKRFKSSLWAS